MAFPWTGGFDACQFGTMEFNGDGFNDLLVFDRRGNRLLTFLNDGIPGEISYTYHPEYAAHFPQMKEWVVFADYNGDGLNDIFTYSPGWAGIQVFKHLATIPPTFEQVVWPYLTSLQGGGYVNIVATNADFPAIYDVDNDGDLDILTFWALGTFIELHLNRSVEKYGHADSLIFEKTDFCWGRVAENEENNILYLDTCLFKNAIPRPEDGFRHRGATMLMHDFDHNGLPDMLLADVDYPGLTLLVNEGTPNEAFITSQDSLFPSYDEPIQLFSMPVTALIDVNNDGKKDLLVSPFDPNPFVTENEKSIWLYLNTGSNELPHFELFTRNFLQDQTIDLGSGAYPVMTDADGDGIPDLIVGNHGTYLRSWYSNNTLHSAYESGLAFFKGSLNEKGEFALQLVDRDFAGLKNLQLMAIVPAFADLDGDGKPELIVGSKNGQLALFQHNDDGNYQLCDVRYLNIDVGEYSAPQFFDLDEDGITDLVISAKNGKMSWYKGSLEGQKLTFSLVTDFLGEVNVTDYNLSYDGFCVPHFFHDTFGHIRLICGSEQGKLFLFDQIEGNLEGAFRETNDWEAVFGFPDAPSGLGMRSSAFTYSLPGEKGIQLMAGNFCGGLQLFSTHKIPVAPGLTENRQSKALFFPNPTSGKTRFWKIPGNEMVICHVFNVLGKLVFETKLHSNESLDIAPLGKGVYFVVLKYGENQSSSKLIVE